MKNPFSSVLEQVTNNTTSWIGKRSADNETLTTGQTFVVPAGGDLEAIEIFPNVVAQPGKLTMTIHTIDQQQGWSPALKTAEVNIKNSESGKWLSFILNGLHLDKDRQYGFKLASNDAYVGVGEAAGTSAKPLLQKGQEWHFTRNAANECFSYFSLAFKVDMRA